MKKDFEEFCLDKMRKEYIEETMPFRIKGHSCVFTSIVVRKFKKMSGKRMLVAYGLSAGNEEVLINIRKSKK